MQKIVQAHRNFIELPEGDKRLLKFVNRVMNVPNFKELADATGASSSIKNTKQEPLDK